MSVCTAATTPLGITVNARSMLHSAGSMPNKSSVDGCPDATCPDGGISSSSSAACDIRSSVDSVIVADMWHRRLASV